MSLQRKRFAKALRVRMGLWAPSPGKGGYGGPVQTRTEMFRSGIDLSRVPSMEEVARIVGEAAQGAIARAPARPRSMINDIRRGLSEIERKSRDLKYGGACLEPGREPEIFRAPLRSLFEAARAAGNDETANAALDYCRLRIGIPGRST